MLITQRGRATAVLVSARAYQETQRELEILKMLARSKREIEQGATHDMASVMAEAEIIVAPYRVFYAVLGDRVVVVGRHSAQLPDAPV